VPVPELTALTVRFTIAVWLKAPEVPVTVTVLVPVVAVLLAASVKVLPANAAVTPLGTPDAVKVTALLKPLEGVVVMVLEPLAPCVIATLLGEAERLKSAAGGGVPAAGFSVAIAVEKILLLPTPAVLSPVK
jgi:hypothetical protein